MGLARGIAGSLVPESEAIFLCNSVEEAEFFVEMAQGEGVDIWAVEAEGLPTAESAGWLICPEAIPPGLVHLHEADAKVGPHSGNSGVLESWSDGSATSWHKTLTDEEAKKLFHERIDTLRQDDLGGIVVERWAAREVVERVELMGERRYATGGISVVLRADRREEDFDSVRDL
jgi:hypothetical protein